MNIYKLPHTYATRIEVESLKLESMPLVVRSSGKLEAKDSHTIKLDFDGPIASKQFREGQKVVKGQLLAEISREKIRLSYQSKVDALKNARDDLKRAKKDLKVEKELYRQQAVAYSAVEDADKTLVKAVQGLRSAEESFKEGQQQWDSAHIISPISGTVVKDWIGEDKTISSGKEIVTVADVSEYTVKANVDELDIKQVTEGQPAEVHLQAYGSASLPAIVKEVGSDSAGTGVPEVPVVLSITDTKGLVLRPKLTAEIRIDTGRTEPVLSVPMTAVANADGNPRVWVLGAWHRIHAVPVQLGRANPDRIEVTQGLHAEESIAVTAEPDFSDGMMVLLEPAGSLSSDSSSKTHTLMKERVKKTLIDKKHASHMP
jgi:RND family efflux transporter MFP subunit